MTRKMGTMEKWIQTKRQKAITRAAAGYARQLKIPQLNLHNLVQLEGVTFIHLCMTDISYLDYGKCGGKMSPRSSLIFW